MSWSANQPVAVGHARSNELTAAVEEGQPGGAEEVLEHARSQEVDVERLDVHGERADRLVGVEQDEGAALPGELDDGLDVGHRTRPVGDVRDRDERRVLVDRPVERLQRHGAVAGDPDVLDPRAARRLRVPDLPDGRKLQVGDDDLRPARVAQAAGEGAHAGRERGRDRDLVRLRVDEPCERRPPCIGALDPVLPRSAVLVPIAEVRLVGAADGVGEGSLRAAVDVDEALEDREAVPDAVGKRARCDGLSGQGRPSGGPRRRAAPSPSRRARPVRSGGRSRDRRSRARRWRSARRRARRRPPRAPAG